MKKIYYLDFLRVFAILSVVFMHILSPYLYKLDAEYWHTINFMDSIVRYSVPIFIMISGSLLLSKNELNIGVFIKKRFTRILLPTFLWSLVYITLYKNINFDFSVLKIIINGPVYYHLWFMYMLISIYIIYPLLWSYVQNTTKSNLQYIILCWFLLISIEPAIQKFYGIHIGIRNEVLTNYMGYFLLGYFLSKYNFHFLYSKLIYFILSLMCIIITAYGTEVLSINKLNLYFYGNTSPNVILLSTFVYLFAKEITFEKIYNKYPFFNTLITNLAATSLGIYLIHPIILNFIKHNNIFTFLNTFPIIQIFLFWGVTTLFSFLIIYLLRKTPLKIMV